MYIITLEMLNFLDLLYIISQNNFLTEYIIMVKDTNEILSIKTQTYRKETKEGTKTR